MGWLSGYEYRKKVTISGSSGAGENYQVKLRIGSSSGGDFHLEGHCIDFPNDIRFTDDDGETLLDYWIEDSTQDPITVWVKVKDNLDNNVDIYCYYGKSGESSASDGSATFEFFDDTEQTVGEGVVITSWSFNAIGYVIEWKAETPSSDGFAAYLTDANGDVNGANFYVDDGGDGKVKEYDGSFHTIADSFTEPVILVTKLISTSTLDYQVYNPDRTLAGEITGANYRGSPTRIDTLWTGSSSSKNWQTHFHWLFIRKYASPEPSFSNVGSEEIEHLTCIDVVRSSDTAFGGGPIQGSCTDILDFISLSSRYSPWLLGFAYRRAIKISGSSGAGTGYQVKLKIGSSSGGDFHLNGHCDNFPNDIRFTKNDGLSLLDYWIEDPSQDPITVWIKIEDNLNEDVNIFCYYGSSLAESESDGNAIFEFFEDFEGGDVEYVATPSNKTTDGFWHAAPKVTIADNGDWVMCYNNGGETNDTEVGIGISTDNGETWTNKGLISNNPNYFCGQPLVIKYPNGKLQCFWNLRDTTKDYNTPEAWGGTEVSTSTDNGQTWSSPEHAHPTLDDDNIVAWQAVTIGNTVYLSATAHVGDPIVFKNVLYKTEDNGETWTKVSDITPSGYTEGGMVHLGNGEFVVVNRDFDKQHTLQRRSTDYGETWTTDGYIKTDGSLGSSPGGSDLILHQARIYNLGDYIIMYAARYPGSYPRDVMLYFSTDDCASWKAGASEIYHGISGTEGDYVPLSLSEGKLLAGYDRRCDISIESVLSLSGWTVTNENVGELKGVSSLVKHGNYAARWYCKATGEAYAYKTIPELRDQDKIIEFWRRGGGYSGEDVTSSVIGLDKSSDIYNGIKLYYNAETHEFQYYDDAFHTILSGVDDSVWYKFGVKVFSDGDDSKFDLWIDDEKKVTGGGTRGSINSVVLFQFQHKTSKNGWVKEYVDAIRVRKYVEPEPSFSSAQDEEGPVFTCGDTLANSSLSAIQREVFPVCSELLSSSDFSNSLLSTISCSQDLLGLTDSNIALVTLLLNAIDSIDVSDGCTLTFSFTSSCLDVLHTIDSASYPLPNVVSCLDSLGTQDSISSFLSMLCQSKDNIGGADGETSQLSVERALLDILAFQDTSSYLAGIIASASDVLNVQDLNSIRLTFSCSSIDVVKNTDSGGVNVTFHLDGNDILKGADFVSGNLQVLLDSLAVFKSSDQSASSLLGFILRSATDVLDVYDLNSATLQISSSSIDIFRTEDNSSINITLHLNSADVFKNSDSAILSLQALLSALETLKAGDSSTASVFAEILASASDLLTTSDYNTVRLEFLGSAIDIVESVDNASSNVTLHLNSSDLLGGTDRVTAKLEALLSAISKFKSSDESRTYEVIYGVPVKIFKAQHKVLVFRAE